MKAKYIGLILLAGATLAGCGGSSSSSAPASSAAKVTITAQNQSSVTSAAINASNLNLGSGFAAAAGGVQTSTNSNDDRLLFNVADYAVQRMANSQTSPMSVIGVATTYNCLVSGTYTVDTDNATYYKETDTNCLDYANGTTYNGHIYITGVSNTSSTFTASLDLDFTMAPSSGSALKFIGGFNLSQTGKGTAARTDSLQGTSLVLSLGTVSFSMTNFNFQSTYNNNSTTPIVYNNNINYTIGLVDTANTASNFSFGFATTQNNLLVKSSALTYISTGQFVVTGDASTALRVTFLPTSGSNFAGTSSGLIKLEISTDGGATYPTANATTKTWATL